MSEKQTFMNDRKKILKRDQNPYLGRGEFDPASEEAEWKLEALDELFRQTRDHAEEFHELYVKPLLAEELSLETALELVVAGVFRPN